jgi:hypothetical protein
MDLGVVPKLDARDEELQKHGQVEVLQLLDH